ncbi:MAG: Calcineurin-like phosphoesterase [Firmicutes bacterium]|nr:Calcineurin-like phosphoesterase [Bacillota bacterium]
MLSKKLLRMILLFVFFIGTGTYFTFGETLSGPTPHYVTQTITTDSKTTRTISWQTTPSDVEQFLEYKKINQEQTTLLAATSQKLPTNAEDMTLHCVTLTSLTPGTSYAYRVGSHNNWSDWQEFTTEPPDNSSFKAIIFGDSQSSDYDVWKQTAQTAWSKNKDAAFFINMGDLVDIGSHYDQWKSWFTGAKGMIDTIPVAPLSGNHENYLPGGTFSPAFLYLALFDLPMNGPDDLKGQAYSFDYSDVHFIVLDSQAEELGNFQPDLLMKQGTWLEKNLKETTKPWKIVLIHRGLFSYPDASHLNELGNAFVPIFDQYHVDLVFTAHIHTYGRTIPLLGGNPAETGTVYISTGRSGDKTWSDSKRKPTEIVYDDGMDMPNYLTLEVTEHALKIINVKQDGTLVDEVELKK